MTLSRHVATAGLAVVAAVAALAACRSSSGDAAPHASAQAAPSVTKPPPPEAGAAQAAATESRDGSAALLTPAEARAVAGYRSAMRAGREATRDAHFDAAEAAFGEALTARPGDARALAERGYERLLAGSLEDASRDFERALAGGVPPQLTSQVFFNMGLLREKQGKPDAARAAFAIADAVAPSAAAKKKLAGRSACTADVELGDDPRDALTLAADFADLAKQIGPAKDLGSPKASVCIQTHTAIAEPDAIGVCDGPPPWVLAHHHLSFIENAYFVVPRKGGLAYYQAMVGGWPAHCTSLPSYEPTLEGDLLHLHETFDGAMAALDESAPIPPGAMQLPCIDVVGYESHAFFDPDTGRRLLEVRMPAKVPRPTVTIASGKVTLSGAGCDRIYDLAALRRGDAGAPRP
jgi:tetratricopeptide (TPR) repeat protein